MTSDAQAIEDFIARWEPSGGGERSNCQMFLAELCRLLEVGEPDPIRLAPPSTVDGPELGFF